MPKLDKVSMNNTTISATDTARLLVTLHATPVVTVYNDGRILLDHGGYMSSTTKNRINQTANQFRLGFRVYQEAHEWFVADAGDKYAWTARTIAYDPSTGAWS